MGRSILHRKVIQNRRRALDPSADHLMAATHFASNAYDEYVEARDNPPVAEANVTLKASELATLLARIDSLEAKADARDNPPVVEGECHAVSDAADAVSPEQ